MKKGLKIALGATAAVALAGVNYAPSLVSAWGDNGGGRTTYTIDQINKGAIDDKIVFNSISDNPDGNELYFVSARADGSANIWNTNDITVEDGKTYIVRMYVHNNNPRGTEMIAKNVTANFYVPTESGTELSVNGFIDSTNATPSSYWDSVVFKSSQNFHLEYISGSALIENKGKLNGTKLSDNIVTGGTLLGYDSLNGEIPGCFGYSAFVTIKVKATYDYNFSIKKQVKISGTKGWKESVDAKVGDKVDYRIIFENLSDQTATDVVLKDILPGNLKFVDGSMKLTNGSHPDGIALSGNDIVAGGLNIGSYKKNANAALIFTAEVVDEDLGCGNNTLRNWAQAYVGNGSNPTGVKQDDADVVVAKTCSEPVEPVEPVEPTTPEKLPETGAGSIVASALGLGSIVASAGYYISSRKKLA